MLTPSDNLHIERLNDAITHILEPQDSRAFSFSSNVKNRIRQFNLTNHLDCNEVINEAYQRGIAAVEAGKVIEHWQAWLKATCFNIVREASRARQRMPSIDPQSHAIANLQAVEIDRAEMEASIKKALKRVMCLTRALEVYAEQEPELAHLLQLKLVDRWSWQRIREHLVQQSSDEVPSVAVLRKRASRGKTKIRRLYHQIEEEYVEATVS